MNIAEMVKSAGSWMSARAADADVVISSRVRLARNIGGYPFLTRASRDQRRALELLSSGAILNARLDEDMEYLPLIEAESLDRYVLVERHLISHELADGEGERGVAVGAGETLSIMVNEEDHLRIQALRAGLQLDEAYAAVNTADDAIALRLPYAFRPDFGYLTACPTNVGTGMRVSVMVHLPGLVMSRHLEKVFNAMAKLDMVVRGLYGEGTEAVGDLYQISNQRTLGKTEGDIIAALKSVMPQITAYERRVRAAMLRDDRPQVEDQVFRAQGILLSARMISSEETLYLLSRLRLGVNLGIIESVDVGTINRLLITTRAAHLQKMVGRDMTKEERHAVRADYVRRTLAGEAFDARAASVFQDRFTAHARRALAIAEEEARARGGGVTGTEHLLLGVLRDSDGIAARVLRHLGLDVAHVRAEVEERLPPRQTPPKPGTAPFSARAAQALRRAAEEGRRHEHRHVGTEHLLLGLLADAESTAGSALAAHGVSFNGVQEEVLRLLGEGPDAGADAAGADHSG